jgi:hypothetical protein
LREIFHYLFRISREIPSFSGILPSAGRKLVFSKGKGLRSMGGDLLEDFIMGRREVRKMKIQIITNKSIDGKGRRRREIAGINAKEHSELPEIYLEGGDFCYLYGKRDEGKEYNALFCSACLNFQEGDSLAEEDFQDKIAFIRKCAKRLKECNRFLQECREDWWGEEILEI